MSSTQIVNPDLPFCNPIPGGLSVGKEIQIQGLFPQVFDASQHTKIDLCETMSEAIALRIIIRFNNRQVIRNTFYKNKWQQRDEDDPFPFVEGRQFLIQIVVQPNCYQISVNGQHCWTYGHRLPYSAVTHLKIDGPLIIWNLSFKSNTQVQEEHLQLPPRTMRLVDNPVQVEHLQLPSRTMRLVDNPHLPYWGELPQRLAEGSVVEIMGSFPTSIDGYQNTEISLCQNSMSTIAFHLSIHINDFAVVLNTYRKGTWETEERRDQFPVSLGKKFLIKIVVQLFYYQISVNGVHCWSFSHRLPFGMVNGLGIDGPVKIHHVDYTSTMENQQMPQQQQQPTHVPAPPGTHRQQPTDVHTPPVSTQTQQQVSSSLHNVYNPVVPFFYHINGGIKANMIISISGVPFPNFHKFTISLECGHQDACADVAFQFDVRGYNSTAVRNTRHNNRWEDEEMAAPSFPFKPLVPFEIMILVQNDKYMVSVNGTYFIQYYHRMCRFTRINVLKIENEVRIASVRFSEQHQSHTPPNYNKSTNDEW